MGPVSARHLLIKREVLRQGRVLNPPIARERFAVQMISTPYLYGHPLRKCRTCHWVVGLPAVRAPCTWELLDGVLIPPPSVIARFTHVRPRASVAKYSSTKLFLRRDIAGMLSPLYSAIAGIRRAVVVVAMPDFEGNSLRKSITRNWVGLREVSVRACYAGHRAHGRFVPNPAFLSGLTHASLPPNLHRPPLKP